MKVKCGDCGKLLELEDVRPTLDQTGAFWWRFWLLMGPVIGVVILSLIGWGVFSSYSARKETESFLKELSIKVKVLEFPNGSQMREFSR